MGKTTQTRPRVNNLRRSRDLYPVSVTESSLCTTFTYFADLADRTAQPAAGPRIVRPIRV